MKKCTKCGVEKPLSEFHKKKDNKDGLQNACKSCRVFENNNHYSKNKTKRLLWQKDYYKNNTESVKNRGKDWRKANKNHSENYDLLRNYGITAEQKQQMIEQQNNSCAICQNKFKDKKSAHVDHCHTTGKVRSILCSGCNTGLGLFKESQMYLKSALLYLKKYNSKSGEK
jgi:hypothetical protein